MTEDFLVADAATEALDGGQKKTPWPRHTHDLCFLCGQEEEAIIDHIVVSFVFSQEQEVWWHVHRTLREIGQLHTCNNILDWWHVGEHSGPDPGRMVSIPSSH